MRTTVTFSIALLTALAPDLSAQVSPAATAPASAAIGTSSTFDGPPPPQAPDVVARDNAGRVTIRATRLDAPLRLDGALDESIYHTVPGISDFVQVEPDDGAVATEKTEVWLAFDDDHVYVGFRNWESDPARRVATEMRRDNGATWQGNDVVSVFLDPFYDRRNGIGFTINSIGGRNDGQITNERQYLGDWNPIWDFATGRFEGGWTAEMAIPFKSIRFREGDAQIWGFNALRAVRWKNELSTVTRIPPGRGMNSVQQSSMAATLVGLETPGGSRNLDIKPYVTSSVTSLANAGKTDHDLDGDIGLDLKYGVTQSLSADFTYNTDFAQVEADEAQLNLTRFSLFFPEKREFFLENQGTFSFGGISTTGNNAGGGDAPILFYSRRIGLDEGRVVPIQGGGRLTGRAGRYSLGLLNIQTGDDDLSDTGAANFSVVRLKRDVLRRSSIGLLLTGRSVSQQGAGANVAGGIDGTFGFFNDLTINTYWARSKSDDRSGNEASYRAHLDLNGDRYGAQIEHLSVGANFNPDVGFLRRRDIRRSFAQARFSPRPQSIEALRRFWWMASSAYIENGAGRVEMREHEAEFALEFQNSDRLSVVHTRTYEFLPRAFDIADGVSLPIGSYDYGVTRVAWNLGQQRAVSAQMYVEHGSFYSGTRTTISATRGRFNVGAQLAVEPSYTINWVDLVEGKFTAHLAGARVTYTMTPRMFVSSLLQYSSANNSVNANVRLRWEYLPGSELFVVYNDERDTRTAGFPMMSNRGLIVKINRLFRL